MCHLRVCIDADNKNNNTYWNSVYGFSNDKTAWDERVSVRATEKTKGTEFVCVYAAEYVYAGVNELGDFFFRALINATQVANCDGCERSQTFALHLHCRNSPDISIFLRTQQIMTKSVKSGFSSFIYSIWSWSKCNTNFSLVDFCAKMPFICLSVRSKDK